MPRLSKIGAAALGAFGWTSGSSISASYLVVAGGAGGGSGNYGGGGGAGGLLAGTTALNPLLSYTVTVGAGGIAGTYASGGTGIGGSGGNSLLGSLVTSTGGGGGGGGSATGSIGNNGGSGGGGAGVGNNAGGTGVSGQGFAGASGTSNNTGGGGGGSSAVGSSKNGGNGTASSISGTSTTYAGGGAAFAASGGGTAGTGGGGAVNTSGTANLGGGGGADNGSGAGQGGSGVVIISYAGAQQFGGGVVTSSGGYTIHTFNTSGTLSPLSSLTASYLVVAGGAGGATQHGGGGGAGGLRSTVTNTGGGGSLESALTIDTNSTYLVTVGAGGAGTPAGGNNDRPVSTNGSNSAFLNITSTGGGGGAPYRSGVPPTINAVAGGSGGGGAAADGAQSTGGAGTANQGFAGGNGRSGTGSFYNAAGGGGAGAVGVTPTSAGAAGNGGVGVSSLISGTSTFYAGGGGGGTGDGTAGGTGGNGGGGAGTVGAITGNNGTANLGGGGGGGGSYTVAGGAGGSGVVIISYAGATQSMAGGTVTISGGNVIHTFTSSGYLTPLKLVNNSLRFRSSASAYLNRTLTTPTLSTKWTWSGWFKIGAITSANETIFDGGSPDTRFGREGTAQGPGQLYVSNDTTTFLLTSAIYRDFAAWYHAVLAFDSSQGTASNRLRLYINGSEVTAFATDNRSSISGAIGINTATAHGIGRQPSGGSAYFDGYMTECNFIDGQQLTPNSFGTFNSYGVWQPITYGGSYGTNGFYLPFSSSNSSSYAGFFSGSSYSLTTTATQIIPATGDFTIEALINFGSLASYPVIACQGTAGQPGRSIFLVSSNGKLELQNDLTSIGSAVGAITTNRWYYVAVTRSGANSALYINGVQVAINSTTFGTIQNTTLRIGVDFSSDYISSGYVSNFRVSSVVRTISTTAPTTAFTNDASTIFLTLQSATVVDNSTNAYAITNSGTVTTSVQYPFSYNVFNDYSPQGNNWTPNNISGLSGSTYDSMTDVPTLTSTTAANYAVLNPLRPASYSNGTITDGNLKFSQAAASYVSTNSNVYMTTGSGQWYWEVTCTSIGFVTSIGIGNIVSANGAAASGTWCYHYDGSKYVNGANSAYGASYTSGDVLGFAFDATTGSLTCYKNGTSQGVLATGLTSGPYFAFGTLYGTWNVAYNFGQQPFKYTPPTGYLALNTYNI